MTIEQQEELKVLWQELVLQCSCSFTKSINVGSKKRRFVIQQINEMLANKPVEKKLQVAYTTMN